MARTSSWPFAHYPDNFAGTCTECGKDRRVILVMCEDPTDTPGSFLLLCWACLGRDGDPLHDMRARAR